MWPAAPSSGSCGPAARANPPQRPSSPLLRAGCSRELPRSTVAGARGSVSSRRCGRRRGGTSCRRTRDGRRAPRRRSRLSPRQGPRSAGCRSRTPGRHGRPRSRCGPSAAAPRRSGRRLRSNARRHRADRCCARGSRSLPLKLAKVCPSWRALLTSVIFGTSNGCWTAWVSVSQRYGVSIQCRPPTAAALSSGVRSCSSVHCQIAKSSRRPSGKTERELRADHGRLGQADLEHATREVDRGRRRWRGRRRRRQLGQADAERLELVPRAREGLDLAHHLGAGDVVADDRDADRHGIGQVRELERRIGVVRVRPGDLVVELAPRRRTDPFPASSAPSSRPGGC